MKIFTKLLAILSICIFFTGCGDESKSESEVKVEPLKVGASIAFPPFGFKDDSSRDYQGFDIDLIQAIGRELGRPVQLSSISFDGLVPTIQSKNIDLAISGITITDERKKSLLFSDPYFESGLQIVVHEDNSDINSLDDLKGKRIAVQIGTTSDSQAQQIEDAILTKLDTPAECFEELAKNQVDAVINDRPSNAFMLARGQIANVRMLPELLTYEEYGIAAMPDRAELIQQINDALKKVRDSGEYYRIYTKWFGEPKD